MANQVLTFNDALGLVGLAGSATLSGSVGVTYGASPSVTGTLTVSALGVLGAQTYSSLTITQTGFDANGIPTYVLSGTNGVTNLSIDYTGMAPATIAAGVTNSLNVALAGNALAVVTSVVCFAKGTMIRTHRGEVAVEALKIGDKAITASGKRLPIKWLGHNSIDCRSHPEPRAVLPIRIAADAFAPNVPSRDLFVSPGHGILVQVVDEVLMPAGLLCNGTTVQQIEVDHVDYWHVELDGHDILFSNGLRSESYIDVGNRAFFGGVATAKPDGAPSVATLEHYCRPYIVDDALVCAVRQRLQARAMALGWTLDAAPLADLHLVIDGKVQRPEVDGLTARFVVPAGVTEVWLQSESSIPLTLFDSVDARRLGVCLKALDVEGRRIGADDPLLCVGFHAAEGVGPTRCRWSTGHALLPAELWQRREATALAVELAGPALPRWVAPVPDARKPALREAA